MYTRRMASPPTDQRKARDRFPQCALHGYCVVVDLPPGCVFASPNPLAAIHELIERAWAHRAVDEFEEANDLFEVTDTCNVCVGEHASNPIIKGLRHDLTRVATDSTVASTKDGRHHQHAA